MNLYSIGVHSLHPEVKRDSWRNSKQGEEWPFNMRKIKHYLEYLGVTFLSRLVSSLTLDHARAIGRVLGTLTFSVFRIRRNVTLINLKHAFPAKDALEICKIALKTYQHFGMMVVEFLRVPAVTQKAIHDAIISVKNESILETIRRAGKGAIFLTAHFGNWEYAGGWLGYRGYPMTVMVQEQSNPFVDRLLRRCRERLGMHTIPRGSAMRSYLKALKAGKYAVMLADQDAGQDGIFLEFLGRKASTAAGPARFHIKTGAPILLFITYRDASGHLMMEIEKLALPQETSDRKNAIIEIMQAYNHSIEMWIRRFPHHWFWMHKRWKTQPRKQNPNDIKITA